MHQAGIRQVAEQADTQRKKTIPECRKVTGRLINDTMLALESLVTADGAREQPHWLTDDGPAGKRTKSLFARERQLASASIKADLSHDECFAAVYAALFSPTSVSYAFDHDPPPRNNGWRSSSRFGPTIKSRSMLTGVVRLLPAPRYPTSQNADDRWCEAIGQGNYRRSARKPHRF